LPWKVQEIEKGLVWKQVHTEALFGGWQHLNLLEINPKKRKLSLAFVTDSLVATSSMAARESALAAVNAGFFNMQKGGSVSLLTVDGKIVNASDPKHVADKSFILKGALVLGPGKRVRVESAQADSSYFPRKYPSVLLTGPMLLENGAEVALAKTPFNDNRHPRTCVCITDERQVLLLTADGRNAQALGLSLPELRTLLAELGCRDAVNLDGGGSTTMWIFGQPDKGIVNMPSDNKLFDHFGERKVANAVLIH
jgi:exopolysaccharide biosynthesis protein